MKKPKKGRPPADNPMVHTAVVLPADLIERLKHDAEMQSADDQASQNTVNLMDHLRRRARMGREGTKAPSEENTSIAGKKSSRPGLSAEIRRRLQLTYDLEGPQTDTETDDLVRSIKKLAENLAGDLGKKWHEHPYVFEAFKAGLAALLAQHEPDGDATARPDTQVVGEPEDRADTVGRTHARFIMKATGTGER